LDINQVVLFHQAGKSTQSLLAELDENVLSFLMNHQLILREKSGEYEFLTTDLNMPIMDGFQAIEYIRNSLNLKEPIIVVTANSEAQELERAKALGANTMVLKPLDEKSVRTALEQVGLI
jgi:CheY-like chemotaxis protein